MSMRSWAGQNMTVTVFPVDDRMSEVVIGGRREQKGSIFGGGGQLAEKIRIRLASILPHLPEPIEAPHPASSPLGELERLVEMHRTGALTDEEFAAAKAKVLSG